MKKIIISILGILLLTTSAFAYGGGGGGFIFWPSFFGGRDNTIFKQNVKDVIDYDFKCSDSKLLTKNNTTLTVTDICDSTDYIFSINGKFSQENHRNFLTFIIHKWEGKKKINDGRLRYLIWARGYQYSEMDVVLKLPKGEYKAYRWTNNKNTEVPFDKVNEDSVYSYYKIQFNSGSPETMIVQI